MSTAARNNAIRVSRHILDNPPLYAIGDTETTGFNGEVVELVIIDSLGNELIHEYRHPKGEMNPKALAVHGLTPEVIDSKGARPWAEWYLRLEYVLNGRILVAYNAPYDVRMIENTAKIEGTASPLTSATSPICIMQLWSDFLGVSKWQKLEGGDHTALGD